MTAAMHPATPVKKKSELAPAASGLGLESIGDGVGVVYWH